MQDPSHAGNARFCSLSALETESGAILVVMVLAVLIYLVKCLLVPLCNWVYWWRMGDSGSERQARKFRELAWYTLYYVVALTAAISVVVHEVRVPLCLCVLWAIPVPSPCCAPHLMLLLPADL